MLIKTKDTTPRQLWCIGEPNPRTLRKLRRRTEGNLRAEQYLDECVLRQEVFEFDMVAVRLLIPNFEPWELLDLKTAIDTVLVQFDCFGEIPKFAGQVDDLSTGYWFLQELRRERWLRLRGTYLDLVRCLRGSEYCDRLERHLALEERKLRNELDAILRNYEKECEGTVVKSRDVLWYYNLNPTVRVVHEE